MPFASSVFARASALLDSLLAYLASYDSISTSHPCGTVVQLNTYLTPCGDDFLQTGFRLWQWLLDFYHFVTTVGPY
jgi:hypothetical protein